MWYGLTLLALGAGGASIQDPTLALTGATQRTIVDSIGRLLASRYVDAAVAPRLGAHLAGRLAEGAFRGDTLPARFAERLTAELNDVVRDLHLRVSHEPTREFVGATGTALGPVTPGGPVRTSRIDGRDSATVARTGFGFSDVRVDDGIGRLRLDRFVPLDWSRPAALAAMARLGEARALVVDLRGNIGGSPDLVALLLTWLTDGPPRRFIANRSRMQGSTEWWTAATFPGTRRPDLPVFFVTGPATASAAEMLVYGARQLGRGTIVGERTAGAGNGGTKLSVGGGLALFVPERQVTQGPGWERTGVTPDVSTDSAAALPTALRLARAATGGDPLAALGDEFTDAASLARWLRFDETEGWPSLTARESVRDGTLRLEPSTSGWYAEWHAPFLFRSVTGDFEASTRLRATGLAGGLPTAPWSLAGLMARAPRTIGPEAWRPAGEQWLFITAGVADALTAPVIETKTTVNSASRLRLDPGCPDWMELRMTRRGAVFTLASRCEGGDWVPRATFERPDLPATLQVGIAAYTDWYTIQGRYGDDAHAFNRVGITDGKRGLIAEVDWIRYRKP